jgi:alpha/beta superfamily hydrolase
LSPTRGVVVTHPHPVYGGQMDNRVVMAIAKVYQGMGWTTLRFNFRGVGGSEGGYDHGRGEQEDLQGAIDFMTSRGIQEIDLSGYSFGAWIICRWAQQRGGKDHRIILVSPPVAFTDFTGIGPIPGLQGVITGEKDEIAPAGMIAASLPRWNPQAALLVLDSADHFYAGRTAILEKGLSDLIFKNNK